MIERHREFQIARVVLALLLIMGVFYLHWPTWIVWPLGLAWLGFCLPGAIVTFGGLVLLFSLDGRGPAQADWMSDEFVIVVSVVIPTVLSMSFFFALFRWLDWREMRRFGKPESTFCARRTREWFWS